MNNNEYYEEYFPGTARQSTLFDIANAIPDPPPKGGGGGGGGETDNPTDQITDSTDSSEGPPIRDCLNTDDLNACELNIQNNDNANGDCFSFDCSIYVPQQQSPLIVGNNFDPRKITDFEVTLGTLQQASTATTVDDLSVRYGGSPGIKYFKTKSIEPSAQTLNTISPLLNTEKNKGYTINGMPVIAAKSYVNSWGYGIAKKPQVVYDFRVSMSCFNWNNPKYADNVSGNTLNLGFCPEEVKSNCINGNCCNGAVYGGIGAPLCNFVKGSADEDAQFAYIAWIYHPGKTQFEELTTSLSTGLEPTWIPTPILFNSNEGLIAGIDNVEIPLSFGQINEDNTIIFSEAIFRECIDHDTGTIIVRLQKIAYQFEKCTPFYSYLTSLDVLTPSQLCNGHSISQRPKRRELSTCGVPEEYGKITSALNDRSLYFASHDLSVSDFDSFLTSNSTPTTFISGHFDGDFIYTPPPNREQDGFEGDLSHINWVVKDYVQNALGQWQEREFPDSTGGSITNSDFNGLTFAGITHNDVAWPGYNCNNWPFATRTNPLTSMTKYTIQIPYDCIISFEYGIQHIFQFPTDTSGFDRETLSNMPILGIESDDGIFVLETGGPVSGSSIIGNPNTTLKTGYFTKTFTANETFSICMLKMGYNPLRGCCSPTCESTPTTWAYGGDILNISNFSVLKSGNLCELTVGNTDTPTQKLIRTGQVATAIVETEYNNSIDNSGYDNSWDGDDQANELGLTNGINGLRILETLVVESDDPDLHVDKGIWVYNHTDNVWVGNCAGQTTIVNGINLNRVYPYWAIRSTCTPYVQAWNGDNCGITNCGYSSNSTIGFNPTLHQCEETGEWRYSDKQYKFVTPGCPHDYNCCCQISFDYVNNPLSWFRIPDSPNDQPFTYSCSDDVILGNYTSTGWNRHCADLARRFCGVDVYCDTIHFPPAGYGAKPKVLQEILPIEEVQKATVDYVHFLNFENYNASDFVDANGKVKLLYVFYGSKPLIGLKRQEANSIYPFNRLIYQGIANADFIGEGAGYYILDKDGPSPIESPFYVYLNRVRVEPISGENKIESTDADYTVNGPVFYVGDSPHPDGEVFSGGGTGDGDGGGGGGGVPGE